MAETPPPKKLELVVMAAAKAEEVVLLLQLLPGMLELLELLAAVLCLRPFMISSGCIGNDGFSKKLLM